MHRNNARDKVCQHTFSGNSSGMAVAKVRAVLCELADMSKVMSRSEDELIEYLIDHCFSQMMAAASTTEQKYWCARMTFYVGRRSPERIAEMEREKGIS